jgi:hypothetical protein
MQESWSSGGKLPREWRQAIKHGKFMYLIAHDDTVCGKIFLYASRGVWRLEPRDVVSTRQAAVQGENP